MIRWIPELVVLGISILSAVFCLFAAATPIVTELSASPIILADNGNIPETGFTSSTTEFEPVSIDAAAISSSVIDTDA